jgi:hypothetical protein
VRSPFLGVRKRPAAHVAATGNYSAPNPYLWHSCATICHNFALLYPLPSCSAVRAQFGTLSGMANPKSAITVITDDGVASCMLDALRDPKEMEVHSGD